MSSLPFILTSFGFLSIPPFSSFSNYCKSCSLTIVSTHLQTHHISRIRFLKPATAQTCSMAPCAGQITASLGEMSKCFVKQPGSEASPSFSHRHWLFWCNNGLLPKPALQVPRSVPLHLLIPLFWNTFQYLESLSKVASKDRYLDSSIYVFYFA